MSWQEYGWLTRTRGSTLVIDPPDSYSLIGLVQTVLAYRYVFYSADWLLLGALLPSFLRLRTLLQLCDSLRQPAGLKPPAVQIENPLD